METLGEFQSRISKTAQGASVDPEVLLGHINDVIEIISRATEWARLSKQTILQTVAEYITGTVSIAVGATAGTGTGTTFTSAMTGRLIRIANALEYFTFTFVGAGAFTIDRPYEAASDAVLASFRVWQPYYELPSDVAAIDSLVSLRFGWDLNEETREWINQNAASRVQSGNPIAYTQAGDSPNNLARIELYPGPIEAEGMPLEYRAKPPLFTVPADTSEEFPDWVSIPCVRRGVMVLLQDGDPMADQAFMNLLDQMKGEDARRTPPSSFRMADRYVRHRADRERQGRPWRNWGVTE